MNLGKDLHVKVSADVGTYVGDMNKAAAATDKVGQSADRAGQAARRRKESTDSTTSSTQQNTDATNRNTESTRQNSDATGEAAVNTDTLGTALVTVGGSLTAVAAAALNTGIAYNTLQQQTRAALGTMLGSAEQANAQMDQLDEFAKTSPFAKDTFIRAQQQMLAFGIETRKVIPYLDAVQNAVAASGGTNDDIAGISATMAKIQASSKITAQDLNEFGNRGVNAAELIGSQMGKTGAQIRSEITAGSLDATDALDALAKGMGERFEGAADGVKDTAVGAFDRVKAAWRDMASSMAEPLVSKNGGGLLVDLLNEAADLMRAFESLPGPVVQVTGTVVALGGAAALAGGTFLLLRPRIMAVKAELDKLNISSRLSADGLRQLDRAALLRNMARGAALLGGMALASMDAAEGFALADTAGYALAGGAMGGPIGAAIGGTIGLLSDLSRSGKDAEEQFKSFTESLTASDLSAYKEGLEALQKTALDSRAAAEQAGDDVGSFFKYAFSSENLSNLSSLAKNGKAAWEANADGAANAEYEVAKFKDALQQLERETVGGAEAQQRYAEGFREVFDPAQAQRFADAVGPILEDIGLDLDTILKEGPDGANWDRAKAAIEAYAESIRTGEYQTSAVGDAISSLGDELTSSAEAASALDDALSALLSPEMDLDAAMASWYEGLGKLRAELTGTADAFNLKTEAGRANSALLRDQVGNLQDMLVAEAGAGASAEELATKLGKGRQAIIEAGEAAGISAGQMNELLDRWGLTPDLVQTVIEQVGADEAKREAEAAADALNNLDGTNANPSVTAPSSDPTKQNVHEMVSSLLGLDLWNATPGVTPPPTGPTTSNVNTMVGSLLGLDRWIARPGVVAPPTGPTVGNVNLMSGRLRTLGNMTATPQVRVGGLRGALDGIAQIGRDLDALSRKSATPRASVTRDAYGSFRSDKNAIVPRYASGGYVTQPHIVRAGMPRAIYGEPETQGESYIPHAMDRRGRATEILSRTADKFGYDLAPRGLEAAADGRVIVVRDQSAPLVGSVSLSAGSKDDARDLFGDLDYALRKLRRGGKG